MSDNAPWYKRFLVVLLAAGLAVALIIGVSWLGTHQGVLQGSGPIIGVIMLAAMIYGVRHQRKPAPPSTRLEDAIAAVTKRHSRVEADVEEGHRASAELPVDNVAPAIVHAPEHDIFAARGLPFTIDPSPQRSGEKIRQRADVERPVELPPVTALENRDAQPELNSQQRIGVDIDESQRPR